jgi:hypothetical protein
LAFPDLAETTEFRFHRERRSSFDHQMMRAAWDNRERFRKNPNAVPVEVSRSLDRRTEPGTRLGQYEDHHGSRAASRSDDSKSRGVEALRAVLPTRGQLLRKSDTDWDVACSLEHRHLRRSGVECSPMSNDIS